MICAGIKCHVSSDISGKTCGKGVSNCGYNRKHQFFALSLDLPLLSFLSIRNKKSITSLCFDESIIGIDTFSCVEVESCCAAIREKLKTVAKSNKVQIEFFVHISKETWILGLRLTHLK
jgi:hypothetical protein